MALDRLTVGIVLLHRTARVVLANAAARAMMAAGAPLRLRQSTLAATVPAHAPPRLIQAALASRPAATIGLPYPEDGRLFTVTALSVRSRDIDRFDDLGLRSVGAMLVIQDPARPLEIPAGWLMDAYGLTMAEARVALGASGATIPETAHRLNVSPNTVKTHLRKIFDKTGTGRQAELARLVAMLGVVRADDKP